MTQFKEYLNESKKFEWGFDLTMIKASKWKSLMKKLGIDSTPKKSKRFWVWKSDTIEIRTGNDPISGKYGGGSGARDDEKDYASYIGINGSDKDEVKMIADYIDANADYVKGESQGRNDYI